MNGVVLYRGPSKLDGKPIVVVMTGLTRKTANAKTGDMLQTWILSDDGDTPASAVLNGKSSSVCGDCPLQSFIKKDGTRGIGACYVNVFTAPQNIYKKYKAGGYPELDKNFHRGLIKGRIIRFGSYGDPAAVPLNVWKWLAKHSKHWTGYTHQWRKCHKAYAKFLMASCETLEDRDLAKSKGYRTFRVRVASAPLAKGEIVCPADKYIRGDRTCETCRACSGQKKSPRAVDVSIIVHGAKYKTERFAMA